MRHALVLLLLFAFACGGDRTQRRRTEPDAGGPGCGNGIIEEAEECDGTDFGNRTCVTEGFESGNLLCSPTCTLLTTSCTKRCGNGVLDPGEACDGDAGVPACSNFGYGVCTALCTADISHCVTDPFGPGGGIVQPQGGGSFLADLPPSGFGDLITAIPALGRLETYKYTVDQGLVIDRKPSTFKTPLWPIAGQLDNVNGTDIAVIDQDQSVDRFVAAATGTSFTLQSLGPLNDGGTADGGTCIPAPFVGVGKVDPDQTDDLVAYRCARTLTLADDFVVFHGGPAPVTKEVVAAANIVAATLADLDGDQLKDILYVSADAPSELRGFRAAGAAFTALSPRSLTISPRFIAGADFDGDSDVDVVAADGTSLHYYENTGTDLAERGTPKNASLKALGAQDLDLDGRADVWFVDGSGLHILRSVGDFSFLPFDESLGDGGTLVSLSTGDVDGDGDPDLAATFGVGGTTTSTTLLLNRIR